MIKEIIILSGLPGSGKTKFIDINYKHKNMYNIISDESYIKLRKNDPSKITNGEMCIFISRTSSSVLVFDGLFLTNNVLNKFYDKIVKAAKNNSNIDMNKVKFTIIHFKENRVACEENDFFRSISDRRKQRSTPTIKSAPFEKPNKKDLKFDFILQLKDVYCMTEDDRNYANYKAQVLKEIGDYAFQDGIVSDGEWCHGGTSYRYDGRAYESSVEDPPEPVNFNKCIRIANRHMSVVDYNTIKAKVLNTKTYNSAGYYGGSETSSTQYFNLRELWNECQLTLENSDNDMIMSNEFKTINGKRYRICYMQED